MEGGYIFAPNVAYAVLVIIGAFVIHEYSQKVIKAKVSTEPQKTDRRGYSILTKARPKSRPKMLSRQNKVACRWRLRPRASGLGPWT